MYLEDDMIYDNELLEINRKTLYKHAFTNIDLLEGKPRAIVLEFHALGAEKAAVLREQGSYEEFEREFAREKVLTVFPYYGYWSWMNDRSAKYVDIIIDAICRMLSIDKNTIPIISTGTSMGGLSAILYSKKAAVTPKACFACCPVIDLVTFATQPNIPGGTRTIYSSLASDDMGKSLREHSPYHIAPYLPKIPYHIYYGAKDLTVPYDLHVRKFMRRMEEYGHNTTCVEVPNTEHEYPYDFPEEIKNEYYNGILKYCFT